MSEELVSLTGIIGIHEDVLDLANELGGKVKAMSKALYPDMEAYIVNISIFEGVGPTGCKYMQVEAKTRVPRA